MESKEYVHPELNEEIPSISSYYVLMKEVRFPYNGKEILYYLGYSVTDNSCCGVGGTSFSFIPGYILNWHKKKSEKGDYISDVEPIVDDETRRDLSKIIKKIETCFQVNFM